MSENNRTGVDVDRVVELHAAGMSDRDISKVMEISHTAVSRCRKRLGLARNRSKTYSLDARMYGRMMELYEKGYTDTEISRQLGVTQATITRTRQGLKLKVNRKPGDRGPGISESKPYWQICNALLRNLTLNKLISQAAREHYNDTGDWDIFFISRVREPLELYHPIPGPYATTNMTKKHARYMVNYEQLMDNVSSAGVPGAAIIELARLYKSTDQETNEELARQAVEESGIVNQYSTVSEVLQNNGKIVSMADHREKWTKYKQDALNFFPDDVPTKLPKPNGGKTPPPPGYKADGRRGKGGGTKNISDHQAWQARNGY